MGREVKRVPMDFAWPDGKTWTGFLNPWYTHRIDCPSCDGGGYNPETRQIADDWYDFANTGARWCDKITQDEVDTLIAENRLWDFWRRWGSNGWEDIDPRPTVTADEVNAWSAGRGLGHDACNRFVCVKARATRLGVYGLCEKCGGDGDLWTPPESKQRAEDWEETPPPSGGGWQLWETVSEGSPVSPVFSTAEGLAQCLADGGGHPIGGSPTYDQALAFVLEGWAPSAMSGPDGLESGVVGVGRISEEVSCG